MPYLVKKTLQQSNINLELTYKPPDGGDGEGGKGGGRRGVRGRGGSGYDYDEDDVSIGVGGGGGDYGGECLFILSYM